MGKGDESHSNMRAFSPTVVRDCSRDDVADRFQKPTGEKQTKKINLAQRSGDYTKRATHELLQKRQRWAFS